MASGFQSWSFTLSILMVLLCAEATIARKMFTDGEHKEDNNHLLISMHKEKDQNVDPSVSIFSTIDDLKVGTNLPLYFSKKDPSTVPPLLSREEADSIPFSKSNLPFLVQFFSIPKDSLQAKAMAYTLKHCELEPINGEVKFCATSLESMLDSARETLGFESNLKVLTTKLISNARNYPFQNYTIMETPTEFSGGKILGCHTMPYPYIVYYCHSQGGGIRVFEVSLLGEKNGERVVSPAVCHMDTSTWDPDHVSFRVLGIEPRSVPVCHFFPLDHLLWI